MAGVPNRRPEVWNGERLSKRHHILVGRDISRHERFFGLFAGQFGKFRTQVNQHQVIIRTARYDFVSTTGERLGHCCRILLYLLLVLLISRFQRFTERHRF